MTDEHRTTPLRSVIPEWPPAWNPFEVFLLILSVTSSVGFLHGSSGSQILDQRLAGSTVILWGICLSVGAVAALVGVLFYAREVRRRTGVLLEMNGLALVGVAAAVYTAVIIRYTHDDLNAVRYVAATQIAYALACFTRAWQDFRALRRARAIYRTLATSLAPGSPDG